MVERKNMENLHLKNLIQKPHGLIILKKLNNPDYYYSKYIPEELIKEIDKYINSLTFTNKEIKKFISHYLGDLKHDNIKMKLNITKQIITLLAKYKLNELDVDDYFDFENVNKEISKIKSIKRIPTDIITFEYMTYFHMKFVLRIYSDKEKNNKISEICLYKL